MPIISVHFPPLQSKSFSQLAQSVHCVSEIVVVISVVVVVVLKSEHLHTEKRPRAQHIPLGQSASVSHFEYGTHFCSVVVVAIVVVLILVALQ